MGSGVGNWKFKVNFASWCRADKGVGLLSRMFFSGRGRNCLCMKRILAFGIACMMAGLQTGTVTAQNSPNQVRDESIKYQRLMALVDAFYVDTVNLHRLTEDAIVKVLADLDPHSMYISREEADEMNEPLEGGFFGIGIQFTILHDTLTVVSVVPGGPSEKVGLCAGDRIVEVDGDAFVGRKLTNVEVRRRLKGGKGTAVEVKVCRGRELLDFRIIRDKIPIYSVNASYMLDGSIGYIKISRFAATTVEEFETAVRELQGAGMKDLILDLQGNGGGYMGAPIGISDNFFDAGKLIVYTEGLSSGRRDEYATSAGLLKNGRVVVLIDGNSASASEIVAGVIQDWDRGLVVGRRSFGKGLVQRAFPLTDGSMVYLTTAHYYTPSGRCIQKSYANGEEEYRAELYNRYLNGELLNADSIVVNDSLRFYTRFKHRVVYGGGGIIPDVFVSVDTSVNYIYLNRLSAKNVIDGYMNDYVDKNRVPLKRQYPDFSLFNREYQVNDTIITALVKAGEKAGVKKDEKSLVQVLPVLKRHLKSYIARDLWGMNEMYMILNEGNDILKKGLETLKDGTYEKKLQYDFTTLQGWYYGGQDGFLSAMPVSPGD